MREPLRDIGTLQDIVERTAATFQSRSSVAVEVALDGPAANAAGAPIRELAPLLREALTNVEKHAKASRVVVSARLDGGELRIEVRDDGVGIGRSAGGPAPGAGHGQGIWSMRERARLLGGTLTIEPLAPGGTALTVSVPFPLRP